MKQFIWKIRFALAIRRLLQIPWKWCWDAAGSWLEMLNGDTSECPVECAEEERDTWLQNV